MTCAICGIRKPRRFCPGVKGDICTICCGTGREQTVDCPLECEYLREAHSHEKINELDPAVVPNSDVELPEQFLAAHEWLLVLLGSAVIEGAKKSPGLTDYDLREAFVSLISTYRAAESGLIYNTMPVNPYAAIVVEAVVTRVTDIQKRARDAQSPSTLGDDLVLKMIIFLQRLEYANNNGRAKSRAFLDFLSRFYPSGPLSLDETDEQSDGESNAAGDDADDSPRVIL